VSKKILVIDDEEDIRTFLEALLIDAGYEVRTASDGVEGYATAVDYQPDLVTLDLAMPNKTGTQFFRKFAKNKDLCDTPVIVVSGLAGRHLAVKEPFAVFNKPIDRDEFLDQVKAALA